MVKKIIKKKIVKKKKIIKNIQKKSVFKEKSGVKEKKDKKPYRLAEYLDFVDWMATPRIEREPETQAEFGEKYGIDKSTLVEWKKKSGFYGKVFEIRKRTCHEKTGDILKALEVECLKGNVSAIRLWLQYTGELSEKSDENLGASPELVEALERMRKILPD